MLPIPKYAELEHERRFLVEPSALPLLENGRLIEDLYLANSRLRLRAITDNATGERTFKFCKKYESANPLSMPITNLYLTEDEYYTFANLPGTKLMKRRCRVVYEGCLFGVDVFEGSLQGLVTCEAESPSHELAKAVPVPPWVIWEVTDDLRFTGAALSKLRIGELRPLLESPIPR